MFYSRRVIAIIILLCTFLFLVPFLFSEPVYTAQTLTADDIIKLKEAGVSDQVILEMIKRGKGIDSEKKMGPVQGLPGGVVESGKQPSTGPGNLRAYVKTARSGKIKVYLKEGDIWKQKGLLLAGDPISSWELAGDVKDLSPGRAELRLEFFSSDGGDDVIIPVQVPGGKYLVVHVELSEEGKTWLTSGRLVWRVREAYHADLIDGTFVNRETVVSR